MITMNDFEKTLADVESKQLKIKAAIEQKRVELSLLESELAQSKVDLTPFLTEVNKTTQAEKLQLAEVLRNSVINKFGMCLKTMTKAGQFVGKLTIHDTFKNSITNELSAVSFVLVDAEYLDSSNAMFCKLEQCETWQIIKLAEMTEIGLERINTIKTLISTKQRMQQKAAQIYTNTQPKRVPTASELNRVNADPSTFIVL